MKDFPKFLDSECGFIKHPPKMISYLTEGGLKHGEIMAFASPVNLGIWPKTNAMAHMVRQAFARGMKPIILGDSYSELKYDLENKVEINEWLNRLINVGSLGHFEPTLTRLAKAIQKIIAGGHYVHGR